VLAHRRRSQDDAALTAHKYRGQLLEIEPITSPPRRLVIEVADLDALAKLAQRYGVLVMHWTRSHVQTFVVHDDGIIYRHRVDRTPRTPSSPSPAAPAAALPRQHGPDRPDESAGHAERS
jgi:hypothetical protein